MKTPKKNAPKNFLENLLDNPADESQPLNQPLPPALPAARQEHVVNTIRLLVANDLALDRVAFWKPGMTKVQLVNDALAAHLAQFEERNKPTPKEDKR